MKRLLLPCLLALFSASHAFAAGEKLTISYVKSPFNLQMIIMKEQRLLEEELAPLNVTTVDWPEINSGARQAQALASGDLDIAGVINTISVIMANSEGNPVKIIAGVARPTDVFAIVSKKAGIRSLKDLKGKTVAGPKGTVLHQLLVAGLVKEGMGARDVNFVQMDIPPAFAALQSGSADAALLAASAVIKARQEGARVIATAAGLVKPMLVIATSESFAQKHPDRVKAVIAAHDRAWQWIADNHKEAIALGAQVQGISIEEAEQLFAWSHFTQRIDAADIPGMEADMRFMLDNGMMRKKIDITPLLLPQAME